MNEAEVVATGRAPDVSANPSLRRTEEFRTWFFLTFVMAPVLAVLTVSGFGFVIWMYQLFAGPPGS
jgi:nitrate reductase NapE